MPLLWNLLAYKRRNNIVHSSSITFHKQLQSLIKKHGSPNFEIILKSNLKQNFGESNYNIIYI